MSELQNKLEPSGDEDYALTDGHDSVWIEVGTISVYIRRYDVGTVIVELCETGNEAESTLATCEASFP